MAVSPSRLSFIDNENHGTRSLFRVCIGTNRNVSGTIRQHERKDLIVSSREAIPISGEVKMQSAMLFLGEVQECSPDSEANWRIHIRLRRTLLVV